MKPPTRVAPASRAGLLALAGLAVVAVACGPSADSPGGPVIFAAASLQDVVAELAHEFERREGQAPVLNFAASNTLAQQILAAPVADVFLSADRRGVDELERAGRTVAGSRRALLGNALVLIAATGAEVSVERPEELAGAEFSFLALADPEAVPAGRYARAALEQIALGDGTLWQALAGRVAPALDVRAALALVESDPSILGIVYRTDARISRRVRVLCELPGRGAARVTYHGALIAGGGRSQLGRRFLDFVTSREGRSIAERHGFGVPAP